MKNAIWAANSLRRKPYFWGGGHGSFFDRGYDCSGTVSFALRGAGALTAPLPSSDFMRYGERGRAAGSPSTPGPATPLPSSPGSASTRPISKTAATPARAGTPTPATPAAIQPAGM